MHELFFKVDNMGERTQNFLMHASKIESNVLVHFLIFLAEPISSPQTL